MDIISLQVANKALKKLNTNYGGWSVNIIAIDGQTTVTSSEEFDVQGTSLKVYVDGIRAILNRDYTLTNSTTLEFKKGLSAGEIVTLTTDIAGIPVYNINYDDTALVAKVGQIETDVTALEDLTSSHVAIIGGHGTEIEGLKEKDVLLLTEIEALKSALDEDGDGSIIDTIADIKAQWSNADDGIKSLIETKATIEQLKALDTSKASIASVHELQIRIHNLEVYKDLHKEQIKEALRKIADLTEALKGYAKVEAVTNVENAIQTQALEFAVNKSKVEVLEKKTLDDYKVKDSYNGRNYTLNLSNGVVTPVLSHVVSTVTNTLAEEVIINVPVEFSINLIPNEDRDIYVRGLFTIPSGVILEHKETVNAEWTRVTDYIGNDSGFAIAEKEMLFRVTIPTEGNITLGFQLKKADNSFIMLNSSVVTSAIAPVEPPVKGGQV